MEIALRVVTWNVGGAKYFELEEENVSSKREIDTDEYKAPMFRKEFRDRLNRALEHIIDIHHPHIIALQEITRYSMSGRAEDNEDIVDYNKFEGKYTYIPHILIDTLRHSALGKWHKIKKDNKWPPEAHLYQGNAFLVRRDLATFPVWSLPNMGSIAYKRNKQRKVPENIENLITMEGLKNTKDQEDLQCLVTLDLENDEIMERKLLEDPKFQKIQKIQKHLACLIELIGQKDPRNQKDLDDLVELKDLCLQNSKDLENLKGLKTASKYAEESIEHSLLESGLYRGDRNTEPRSASALHIVLDKIAGRRFIKPLDVFVVNTHLSTLTLEREGTSATDMEASETRIKQLDTIFNGIVSRYNLWRKKDNYSIREVNDSDLKILRDKAAETTEPKERHAPVWVLCGDFNFVPDSDEYRYIKSRNFADLINNNEFRHGTKSMGFGAVPKITLDYIFSGPLYDAIDPDRIRATISGNSVIYDDLTRISDHCPIFASIPIDIIPEERRV